MPSFAVQDEPVLARIQRDHDFLEADAQGPNQPFSDQSTIFGDQNQPLQVQGQALAVARRLLANTSIKRP